MSETELSLKRPAVDWAYLICRGRVLRAIRNPALTPAAKQVLVVFSLLDNDPYILPERPPVRALARHLALAERTVRQAIAELVEQGCLTFRHTGEAFRPWEGPPSDPDGRPDLAREWAFLSSARAAPSHVEHIAMLARLRDNAIAAKRIATAVSAERTLGRLLAEQMRRGEPVGETAPPAEPEEPEAPLGKPYEPLELISKVNADRALSPAARHALIEVMLDRLDRPVDFPEDDRHHSWAQRIARRHGITVRGARKALAELEDLRIVAQANGDVCVYEDRLEERIRRGTDAPRRLPLCEGLDPIAAHRHRLERLRDLALEQGLVSTALVAERAIGRALTLEEEERAAKHKEKPKEAPAKPPAELPKLTQADILPALRELMDSAPDATAMIYEVLAEVQAEIDAGALAPHVQSTAGGAAAARM
jgi:hypothetical protein